MVKSRLAEEERLSFLAKETLGFLRHKSSYVEVNVVKSSLMRSLNRRFRGQNKTTNVLSFPAPQKFPKPLRGAPKFLGEIYLDPVYIKNQGENIDYLLIHGLLHLLGFGHERYDDRIKMERLEKKLLKWQKIKF